MSCVSDYYNFFRNTGFAGKLSVFNQYNDYYIGKLEPVRSYVDSQHISQGFSAMLNVIKDAFCDLECWKIIGAENVGLILNDIRICISEERIEKAFPGIKITEEFEAALSAINEAICKKCQEECEKQRIKENVAAESRDFEESTVGFDEDKQIRRIESDNSISVSSFKGRTAILLGNYNHSDRTVTLYIKSILEGAKNKFFSDDIDFYNRVYFNFAHQLVATLAHELFHAYHAANYELCGHNWVQDAAKNEIIVESLASYFELKIYDRVLNRYDLAMDLLCGWDKYYTVAWPYSGAKYIRYDSLFPMDEKLNRIIREINVSSAKTLFSDLNDAININDPYYQSEKDGRSAKLLYKLSLEGLSYAQSLLISCEKRDFFQFVESALSKLS